MPRKVVVTTPETEVSEETRTAPLWKVILHDDDVTTMEFVTDLLVRLFKKDREEARKLMYEVHCSGSSVVEITSRERAELYVDQVRSLARPRGFPLVASIEPE